MALILNIETTTNVCSVCLALDGEVIACEESYEPNTHSSSLSLFVDRLFENSRYDVEDIEAVSVSKGPGSYTGLRIGISVAKGICFALRIPLIGISTLKHMAYSAIVQSGDEDGYFCPMLDARRMDVYTALFDKNLNIVVSPILATVDRDFLQEYFPRAFLYFSGNGAYKAKEKLLMNNGFKFLADYRISSTSLAPLAEKASRNREFEDIAYFSPMYLKEFKTS